ncbi:MAG: tRNA (adenosine(37)-N6)-dimethylallyltransferase MiaA [Planctomycetota bacterium]|nr:tRNA (adenosine(37)-N6)-dimethylallyltransferase MiaA [Planctomycetota bacterium]
MRKLFIVSGATATGKSSLAQALASLTSAHIISIDSMKLYRGMDIGTDKPSIHIRSRIPHHLIDIVDAYETYDVARYVKEANTLIERFNNERVPFLFEGGTPLFIKALVEGLFDGAPADVSLRRRLYEEAKEKGVETLYKRLKEIDVQSAERIHKNDLKRIVRALEVYETVGCPISLLQRQFGETKQEYFLVVLWRGKEELRNRIRARLLRMIEEGFVEEVKRLMERGGLSATASQAAGYAEIIEYLSGKTTLVQAMKRIETRHWQLARRQMVWLKSFPNACHICLKGEVNYKVIAEELLSHYGEGTSLCSL